MHLQSVVRKMDTSGSVDSRIAEYGGTIVDMCTRISQARAVHAGLKHL